MRRIVRDSWAWRGGLAADEVTYEPVLADATAGPLTGPPVEHWPVLTSQLEAAWSIPDAERLGIHTLAGPAAAHLALTARTGGVHATLPARLPELVPVFEEIRGGDDAVPVWDEALDLLEAGGVIERTATRLALLRPPAPSVERMVLMRDVLDDHEHRHPDDPVTNRLLRAVWKQTYAGIGVAGFRGLSAAGRLRVVVREPAADEPPPDPFFEVGQASLPEFRNEPGAVLDHGFPERSWVALAQIVPGPQGTSSPLWGTAPEVLAVLLGAGRGFNAVRRALRGTVVWLLLARWSGGRTGLVETSTSTVARALAEVLGLKTDADHRKLSRALLADLERTGLARSVDGPVQGVELLSVPAPDRATVRHALAQWMAWRVSAASEEPLEGTLRISAEHRERFVRGPWAEAFTERRISALVVPGDPEHGGPSPARPLAAGVG
ncbi:hypothetical protein [Patulibacter minatonensis]|uniref:hypothetical protein n=1 Tax=Patulibacter minatonensis TaxID=298163 RepID=UPI00047EF650|nr:hypothetical protein [Patulibacter minatonensis]